jgi:hypothetical protein
VIKNIRALVFLVKYQVVTFAEDVVFRPGLRHEKSNQVEVSHESISND